jgi:uncharacterized RDD family membrane protein YckC
MIRIGTIQKTDPGGQTAEIPWTVIPPEHWPLALLLFLAYHTVLVGRCGQTPGKRFMSLRVVGKEGGRVGYLRAGARALAYLPAIWLYLGIFWILVDRRHRGWHDLVAGTRIGET